MMKWIKSNGKKLEVRDVGPVLYEMVPRLHPLPILDKVLEDSEARELLQSLQRTGAYTGRAKI